LFGHEAFSSPKGKVSLKRPGDEGEQENFTKGLQWNTWVALKEGAEVQTMFWVMGGDVTEGHLTKRGEE